MQGITKGLILFLKKKSLLLPSALEHFPGHVELVQEPEDMMVCLNLGTDLTSTAAKSHITHKAAELGPRFRYGLALSIPGHPKSVLASTHSLPPRFGNNHDGLHYSLWREEKARDLAAPTRQYPVHQARSLDAHALARRQCFLPAVSTQPPTPLIATAASGRRHVPHLVPSPTSTPEPSTRPSACTRTKQTARILQRSRTMSKLSFFRPVIDSEHTVNRGEYSAVRVFRHLIAPLPRWHRHLDSLFDPFFGSFEPDKPQKRAKHV
ncbi:hypothetical protein PSPO01_15622 [Paraphaeosphaeria sporulosa]